MSLLAFQEQFGSGDACRRRLFERRWPEGFRCPRCQHRHGWMLHGRPLVECASCGHQTSVTAGTIFHRSHTPLRKWFLAMYLTAQEKRGISALRLAEFIEVSYETAWLMLHKLRRAMADRDGQHMLAGLVQIDDSYFGGENRGQGLVGRGTTQTKVLVALSVTRIVRDERLIEVPVFGRMVVVPDFTQDTMNATVRRIVAQGTRITSDGWAGFARLHQQGFEHEVKPTADLPEGTEPFPLIHTFISNAKAWIQGTFHGLGYTYKQAYLDEYCCRFCRRRRQDALFDRLLDACLRATPVTAANTAS